ncbi:MAG: hypothetical protein JW825_01620 [Candidatus Methanofastidiosa archaeon]|nr:hypothetical protein [Candidatus Methanofastidiosa archaeon]
MSDSMDAPKGTREKVAGFLRFYTSRPFTPSKICGIVIIVLIIAIVSFLILILLDIVTPMTIASFVISLVGEDVEVTQIGDEEAYSQYLGIMVPQGSGELLSLGEHTAFFKNGSAYIMLSFIEKDLEDAQGYLSGKIEEMASDLRGSGTSYFIQDTTVAGHDAKSIVAESSSKFMIAVWYCDINKRVYIMDAVYGERLDAQTFVDGLVCLGAEGQ